MGWWDEVAHVIRWRSMFVEVVQMTVWIDFPSIMFLGRKDEPSPSSYEYLFQGPTCMIADPECFA